MGSTAVRAFFSSVLTLTLLNLGQQETQYGLLNWVSVALGANRVIK